MCPPVMDRVSVCARKYTSLFGILGAGESIVFKFGTWVATQIPIREKLPTDQGAFELNTQAPTSTKRMTRSVPSRNPNETQIPHRLTAQAHSAIGAAYCVHNG